MSRYRTALGVLLSLVWIVVAYFIYDGSDRPEKANEWGDYFAGMCSPLAFLWLVLGYMQQGEELKHSTEALRLQAQELKQSTLQQAELVAVEREFFKHELEKARDQATAEIYADTPRLRIEQVELLFSTSTLMSVRLHIKNNGGDFHTIRFHPNEPFEFWSGKEVGEIRSGGIERVEVGIPRERFDILVHGITRKGRTLSFSFQLAVDGRGMPYVSSDFEFAPPL